ncbi:MAG: 3-oxoacyl-ACP reductase [Clostridiales bacterium]|uniref:elongation factor P 5-aminopentanone reductase n=1 Tax=Provencibacterium massiliense TaxID=1841868 RepID=UPI000D7AF35A|nr:3-oxoacyl-ACP reductase FabG [Provencibacterium massiliense]PWM38020.1 MAG: 3-oxoacyl-ACP reductase [Clostridiales bacterium]RGB64593.1 SDR family oxidoreductase [Harryflintia acetispora]
MALSKVVLITGASRGIGLACARAFGAAGYRVAINYNQSAARAEALARELIAGGCDAIAVQADVSERAQVERMVRQINLDFGRVDVLVNNAGIAQQKLFCSISPAEWRRMFAVTVDGAYHCCQCVLPGMIARQQGKIVNVSSIWGIAGASCEVHYSAAKAALIGMTKALAKELGPSGITVNCVAPGVVDTEMNQGLDEYTRAALREETPLGVIGSPQDIASAVLFLASEGADFITGQVLSPNGGFVI